MKITKYMLEQLGGVHFLTRTGASVKRDDARGELAIKFPSAARCHLITIAHEKTTNTYSVTAYKTASKKSELPVPKHGWHEEQLRVLVKKLSGMRTIHF